MLSLAFSLKPISFSLVWCCAVTATVLNAVMGKVI